MKISIIIPVFNTSRFLEKCILSIEDIKDIEIIVVDDGSTDDSGNLIQKLSTKFSNLVFKYFFIENSGVSIARNVGISHAKGEYVMFLDSDDYLSPNSVSSLLLELKKSKTDLIIFDLNFKDEFDNLMFLERITPNLIINDLNSLRSQFLLKNLSGYSCNKVFSRKILLKNKLFFDKNIKYQEDVLFCANYFLNINTFSVLNIPFYNYMQHSSSVTHKISNNHIVNLHTILQNIQELYNSYPDTLVFQFKTLIDIIIMSIMNYKKINLYRNELYSINFFQIRKKLSSKYIIAYFLLRTHMLKIFLFLKIKLKKNVTFNHLLLLFFYKNLFKKKE